MMQDLTHRHVPETAKEASTSWRRLRLRAILGSMREQGEKKEAAEVFDSVMGPIRVSEWLVIRQHGLVDGVHCALVDCEDADHFKVLPDVIEVTIEGVIHHLGKTGWNSDSNYCSYQSNAIMARKIR